MQRGRKLSVELKTRQVHSKLVCRNVIDAEFFYEPLNSKKQLLIAGGNGWSHLLMLRNVTCEPLEVLLEFLDASIDMLDSNSQLLCYDSRLHSLLEVEFIQLLLLLKLLLVSSL